jgi:Phasin protein
MAKNRTMDFSTEKSCQLAEQNTERAMQLTNYSLSWMRDVAEQNLRQSRAMMESLLTITRSTVNDTDRHMYDFWQRSLSLTEETFDFAHKLVHANEPQELAHLQSEFVSHQAQALVDNATELGQSMLREVDAMTKSAAGEATETSRRRSEAA